MPAEAAAPGPSNTQPRTTASPMAGTENGRMRRTISRSGSTAATMLLAVSQVHDVGGSERPQHDSDRGEHVRRPRQAIDQVADPSPDRDPGHHGPGDGPAHSHPLPGIALVRTRGHGRPSIA